MKKHKLKLLTRYYDDVANGNKNFEIRKNDRNYKVGDKIILEEILDNEKIVIYTGRKLERTITYITDFMQISDYVVLAIK